jgi:hypothetical protein
MFCISIKSKLKLYSLFLKKTMNKVQFIIFILSITLVVISAYTVVVKNSCPINETCVDFLEYPNLHIAPIEPRL